MEPTARPVGVLVTLFVLLAQFLLGMGVNLFIKVPAHHPGAQAVEYFGGTARSVGWSIAHGPAVLAVHAVLGLLLGINAIILLVQALKWRQRKLVITSALGAIGIVGAGFNGGSFLDYGHDFSSMLMAVGFALAVGSYLVALYLYPGSSQLKG